MVRQKTFQLQEVNQQLSALYSVATVVNQSLDLGTILRNVMHKVLEIFEFDAGRIYLLDANRKGLRLVAYEGFKDAIPTSSYKLGEGHIGKVLETGKPLLFEDTKNKPEFCRLARKKTVLRAEFRDHFSIPIGVKGKTVGVMNFLSKRTHRFSPNEVQLIRSIANHAGIAIENAGLYQESQRREKIQGLLKELSQDITFLDINSLLRKLTDKVRELFKVDVADVRVLEGKRWAVRGVSGIDPNAVPPIQTGTPRGRSGWIVKKRRALMIPDITRGEEIASGETLMRLGIRGYLGVPLFSKDAKVIGVLRGLSYQPREFTQEEVDLLEQLANGAAVAIENARLFEEVRKKSHDLEATNRRLNRLLKEQSALREIFTQINFLDLGYLLHQLTEHALTLLNVDHIQVRLLGEDGLLRTVALAGKGAERYQDRLLKMGRGRSTWVMENRRPLAIKDISQDRVFGPGHQLQEMGVKGYLLVPLVLREQKSIGVLGADSLTERKFTQEEIAIAQQFAAGAAVAIEIARLYEQTKKQAVQLAKDISERKRTEVQLKEGNAELARNQRTLLKVLSDLEESHEELKKAQLQLIQAEKLKSVGRLAAGVAHEVKNPLAIILQGTHYLSKHLPTDIDNVTMALQEVNSAVKRADSVVRELLDFSAPSELSLNTVELNSVVEQSLLLVRHELARTHINAVRELSERLPAVRLDRNKIEQVFVNIFLNAVHAMPEGGTLTIKTYAKQLTEIGHNGGSRRADHFRIGETALIAEVEDTGTGIPKDQLTEIFDPFFTTKATGKGTGLGLTVTKKIIDLHGGTIDIGNRKEGGARATIMFKARGENGHEEETDPAH